MPFTGTRDISDIAVHAPLLPSLDTDTWELPGVRTLQVLYEIDDAAMLSLIPRALHPTIPPTVFFVFTHVPDSPVGSFTIGEARIGCRSAVRPRTFLARGYCDNPEAVKALRDRWGYALLEGEVSLQRFYDRIVGKVVVAGRTVLEASLVNPEAIGGNDVQYLPNVNLARIERDGAVLPRLIQVDPDYVFHSADRGRPAMSTFIPEAFQLPGCQPNYAVSASHTVADVTMPHLRFLIDPAKGPMEGVERVAGKA